MFDFKKFILKNFNLDKNDIALLDQIVDELQEEYPEQDEICEYTIYDAFDEKLFKLKNK